MWYNNNNFVCCYENIQMHNSLQKSENTDLIRRYSMFNAKKKAFMLFFSSPLLWILLEEREMIYIICGAFYIPNVAFENSRSSQRHIFGKYKWQKKKKRGIMVNKRWAHLLCESRTGRTAGGIGVVGIFEIISVRRRRRRQTLTIALVKTRRRPA